jgi:hypothetical protein
MKRLTKLLASNCRGRGYCIILVHQRGGNDGWNDSRHNHAGHRYQRCNQHTCRSQAAGARASMAGAWTAMAGAWRVWLPLLPSRLVRLPLLASSGL